jgi:branched-chain amino acid transport system ATP-binding protein
VQAGEVAALLGRNGMGKTTTIATVMGILRPTAGQVRFGGTRLDGLPPYRIARHGLGLVPEGRQVIPNLTVHENLVATASARAAVRPVWTEARVLTLFPPLRERRRTMAALLSGGEQQMLAISRALMTNPRLLILDEATEGLAPPRTRRDLAGARPTQARRYGDPAGRQECRRRRKACRPALRP